MEWHFGFWTLLNEFPSKWNRQFFIRRVSLSFSHWNGHPEYIILHLKTHRDRSGLVVFTVVAYPPKTLADGSTDVRPQATGISVTWILCVWIIGTAKSEDVGIFGTYLKMWYFGSAVWPLPLTAMAFSGSQWMTREAMAMGNRQN